MGKTEARLQSTIASFLRDNGVYVLVTRVLPGVPKGCPDIIGLYGDRHVEIEVKDSPTAKYQQGQAETLERLRRGNHWVFRADPTTWPAIKQEIITDFL